MGDIVVPVCPECGSEDIVKDATAAWSHAEQDWTLAGTQDNCVCQACEWQGANPRWLKAD